MAQSNLFDNQGIPAKSKNNPTMAYRPASTSPAGALEGAVPQRRPAGAAAPKRAARRPTAQNRPATRAASGGGGGTGKKPPRKTTGGGGGGRGKGPKKKSVAKIILLNLFKTFLVLGCLGVMVVSIAAVPLMQWIMDETQADSLNLLDLDARKISQTSKIMYRNAQDEIVEYQTIFGADTNRIWTGLSDLPEDMQNAAIATEDRSFLKHNGFSMIGTIRAGFNKLFKLGPAFGASTITQQLVKNLTNEKETEGIEGIQRKILEIYRAWSLEQSYSKDMIMESYLNTIPLSGTLTGAYTGAQQYFNKLPKELTTAECATIVGITNAPGRYDPYVNPEACLKRRNDVLFFMERDGYMSQDHYQIEVNKPLGMYEGERETQISGNTVNNYFVDALYGEVLRGLVESGFASDLNEAHYMYYNGGLRIVATINPAVQTAMEEVYKRGYGPQSEGFIFPELSASKVEMQDGKQVQIEGQDLTQSAMVVLDYKGALKGVIGGIGEKTADLTLNRAVDSVRQVGSTMKPVAAYPLGIDSGVITYSSVLEDSPSQFRGNPVYDPDTGLPRYDWPSNFANAVSNQPMLITTAMAKSTNTIAVRVGERVGVDNMFDFLTSTLGVTSLEGEGAVNDRGYSSLVLGGMTHGMSPYQLAGAYQMLGNEGVYTPVHCYEEVQDANGNILFKFKGASTQAIQPATAFIMRELLSGVMASGGTAAGMKPAGVNEAVAKTGTTGNADSETDRWFVGLTPDYVGVVWWGYDQNQHIKWSAGARTNPPPLVWKTVMETLYADRPEQNSFPGKPDDLVEKNFCTESGYAATPNCPSQQLGYYLVERVPEDCFLHDGTAPAEGE